jgi:hypothetical protein
MLDLVHPFTIYKISIRLRRNQPPCLVFHQGNILIFHCGFSLRSREGFLQAVGLTRGGKVGIAYRAIIELLGFLDAIL